MRAARLNMKLYWLIFFATAATVAAAATPAKPGNGSISGTIAPAAQCTKVEALSRTGQDPRKPVVYAGTYDSKTGNFTIENLPDGTYDLRLSIENGTIEGADMRLEKPNDDREFSDADRQEILGKIENYPDDFIDIHRSLSVIGNGSHAKALVENIRYRDFHSGGKGEMIWRMEVWLYDYCNGGWVKRQHGWQVLDRIRTGDKNDMSNQAFHDLTRLYDQKLGGIDVANSANVSGIKYDIPKEPDMTMGKTPGSIEKQMDADIEKKKTADVVY